MGLIDSYRRTLELTEIEESLQVFGNCLLNKQKLKIPVKWPNARPMLLSLLQFPDSFKLQQLRET